MRGQGATTSLCFCFMEIQLGHSSIEKSSNASVRKSVALLRTTSGGLSEKLNFRNFPYDLQTHSGNLIDLLDNLGVKKVILVLHDWGGAIGLAAFRNQPEQIEKIVLLNTAAFPSTDAAKRILLCRTPVLGQILVFGLNGFAGPAT